MESIITFKDFHDNLESKKVINDHHSTLHMVNWNDLSKSDINEIEKEALCIMGNYMAAKAMCCTKLGCRNSEHLREIDKLFQLMLTAVEIASDRFVKVKHRKNKFKVIPGWNRNVKQLYLTARSKYLNWIAMGRIRDSGEFLEMTESRKLFKIALNDCKINELRERSLSVEEKYRNKNVKDFWKEIRLMQNKVKFSRLIDGKNDRNEIINIFNNKFLTGENIQN